MGFIEYLAVLLTLTSLIYFLSFYVASHSHDNEKISIYENGFEPIGDSHKQIDIIYWFIGLIYLIFDLELIFIFPFISIIYTFTNLLSIIVYFIFIIILALGFLYEISEKALDII